jgi:hypothetical protein
LRRRITAVKEGPVFTAARAAAALVALGALAAVPATASAAHRHNLKLYKVERQISISSNDASATASCDSGDYALDGMWRVDNVDGAPPTSVGVAESHGDAADPATYHFRFTKSVPGQAQLKVFITCFGGKTTDGSHSWSISPQRTASFSAGPGIGYGWQPAACAPGEIAVAPGFAFTSGSGRVVGSRAPLSNEFDPLRNWSFAFVLDGPSSWTTSLRCLSLTSSVAHGHSHKIQVTTVNDPGPSQTVNPGETTELRVNCNDYSKGMVAGIDTTGPFALQDWFLGMDPRIKQRAFKFFNSGVTPMQVWVGLTCFNDRTTKA